MEFNISTPALLFSAISLLMLAYTNRFLALANLIRQFIPIYKSNPDDKILSQINNFKIRLNIIKYTQVLGVLSFLCCVICMFLIILKFPDTAEFIFLISLILMMLSLVFSLYEIFISIVALKFELESIESTHK